jgi:hypothetical protein
MMLLVGFEAVMAAGDAARNKIIMDPQNST